MTEQELIEQLADKEHGSWARWMNYVFDVGKTNEDGSFTIPAEYVTRWLRQANTRYAELTEREKQSDRDEVAHILPIINSYQDLAQKILDIIREATERANKVSETFAVDNMDAALDDIEALCKEQLQK